MAATAAAYTIGANGSPGVVVTPNPNSAGSIATYTIANAKASAGDDRRQLDDRAATARQAPCSPMPRAITA